MSLISSGLQSQRPYRLRRVCLILLIFLALMLACGAGMQTWLSARNQPAVPGKLIAVGTHRLHLHCQGQGQPVIVLEAGLSGWSQDWSVVQPQLAKTSTVCSYDRAGYAWSDEASAPRTGVAAVEDLRTLLRKAGLPGPVLLVGHSMGGLLGQLYAQRYPGEVAGLVLVDGVPRDMYASMPVADLARYQRKMGRLTAAAAAMAPFGLTRLLNLPASVIVDKLPSAEQATARHFAMQSQNYRALAAEFRGLDAALAQARALPPARVATLVLSSQALSEFPPGWETPEMRQHWIAGQVRMAGELNARQVVLPDAGHFLQIDRPAAVIGAVTHMLAQVRSAPVP